MIAILAVIPKLYCSYYVSCTVYHWLRCDPSYSMCVCMCVALHNGVQVHKCPCTCVCSYVVHVHVHDMLIGFDA